MVPSGGSISSCWYKLLTSASDTSQRIRLPLQLPVCFYNYEQDNLGNRRWEGDLRSVISPFELCQVTVQIKSSTFENTLSIRNDDIAAAADRQEASKGTCAAACKADAVTRIQVAGLRQYTHMISTE